MADEGYDKDKHPEPWEWVRRREKHPAQGAGVVALAASIARVFWRRG